MVGEEATARFVGANGRFPEIGSAGENLMSRRLIRRSPAHRKVHDAEDDAPGGKVRPTASLPPARPVGASPP